MSHSQFHSKNCFYLDMHGLIFETSIWLLAGSTRLLSFGHSAWPTPKGSAEHQDIQLVGVFIANFCLSPEVGIPDTHSSPQSRLRR